MKKNPIITYIVACLWCWATLIPLRADDSATASGATNVRIDQRAATAPYARTPRNIQGSANLWEALGFNADGTLTAISINDMLTNGSPAITSAMLTDGTIVNADINASAAIADSKLATISTAGKVSDSALSANVALEGTANTFTQAQTINLAGTTALTTGRSDGVADGTGQELRVLLGTGGGDTSGTLLAHYSLTGGSKTAKNYIRLYDTGIRFDDAAASPLLDLNMSLDTVGIGASAGSEQFYGKLYIGGTFNTSATNNVRGVLVNPEVTLGSGFAIAGYDVSLTTLGSANNDHIASFQARATHDSDGTLVDHYGLASIPVNNGGTVTNVKHVAAFDTTGTGSVTNQYGLYVHELTKATNDYAVYTAGATPSYFGGPITANSGIIGLGTTRSGTQASPTTTNPLAPTWTTQDYVLYYGATGEIDLPAVASYAGKTIFIYITGSFTVTVDPNGSEIIVEAGASLGAGTADVVAGSAGTFVGYSCDGSRWIKLESGGGSGSGFPLTADVDLAGYNMSNGGTITATTFTGAHTGDASGLTDIPGAEINGPLPDLTYGQITTSEAMVHTPTAGVSNVVVTTDTETTITLDATTETLTYSGTPATGTRFSYHLTAHSADCTVTIPSTYSFGTGGNRTSFVVRQNKNAYITVIRTASAYYMWGDPVEIGTLPEDTTPATTAKVEIDQGSGGEFTTLASIKTALNLGGSKSGTFGTPTTTNPLSVTWDGEFYVVYYGATGEIDLPAAASYTNRGITIYNTGSFTITVDPNASEVIVRDGTAQTGGVTFTLSSGAGNFVNIVSDGEKWITLGYKGTLTVGS